MEKFLKIGIIQAIVNPNLAWSDTPQMDVYEANVIWRQIQAAFASFQEMSDTKKPDIVVPHGSIHDRSYAAYAPRP